jgi:hypothetical protein
MGEGACRGLRRDLCAPPRHYAPRPHSGKTQKNWGPSYSLFNTQPGSNKTTDLRSYSNHTEPDQRPPRLGRPQSVTPPIEVKSRPRGEQMTIGVAPRVSSSQSDLSRSNLVDLVDLDLARSRQALRYEEAAIYAWLPPGGVQGWRACSHAQPGCPTRGAPPAEHRKEASLTYCDWAHV